MKKGEKQEFTRLVANIIDKHSQNHAEAMKKEAEKELENLLSKGKEGLLRENRAFFAEAKEKADIEIDGDPDDQQGIRFCLFNLLQAYSG